MTQFEPFLTPTTLLAIAAPFKAVVFDQWGVLHDGRDAYAGAAQAIEALAAQGKALAVLSNSGKRAAPNAKRIADIGLPAHHFGQVMTSGEAFWQDHAAGRLSLGLVYAITAKPGDFSVWSGTLNIKEASSIDDASAIVLMGLPEGSDGSHEMALLHGARERGLPLICTNPDRGSPRPGGLVQIAPGALAHAYKDAGGDVTFYGKPHLPVFAALQHALGVRAEEILMVGDSLEHDVAGGAGAGWKTAFVMGGLHATAFVDPDAEPANAALRELADAHRAPLPDFMIHHLADPGG
ncbi:MAG: TIGR01459 family HAD-type hydrolase [Devosiaceae bacterium]|nr:TIGR01459 family HAD-type hydrolase [Devosiaceae bacterium MH13]